MAQRAKAKRRARRSLAGSPPGLLAGRRLLGSAPELHAGLRDCAHDQIRLGGVGIGHPEFPDAFRNRLDVVSPRLSVRTKLSNVSVALAAGLARSISSASSRSAPRSCLRSSSVFMTRSRGS
jgi:hypothetical protein